MDTASTIIAMERAALDRWGRGDPSGFLEISADDVVYFDPFLERRIDGLEALAQYYESIRGQVQSPATSCSTRRCRWRATPRS
jgi:hypothetical protein